MTEADSLSQEAPLRRLAISLLAILAGLFVLADPAGAQSDDNTDSDSVTADLPTVDVLQVSGYFDPILISEIRNAIDRAAIAAIAPLAPTAPMALMKPMNTLPLGSGPPIRYDCITHGDCRTPLPSDC